MRLRQRGLHSLPNRRQRYSSHTAQFAAFCSEWNEKLNKQSGEVHADINYCYPLHCCLFTFCTLLLGGMRWRRWLRHCATSRNVAGSIPYGVTGIFYWHPSGRTMALRSTQPLTEMSSRTMSWRGGGKGGRCIGLTTLSPSYAKCLEILEVSKS
jgi:hypothetical protein